MLRSWRYSLIQITRLLCFGGGGGGGGDTVLAITVFFPCAATSYSVLTVVSNNLEDSELSDSLDH